MNEPYPIVINGYTAKIDIKGYEVLIDIDMLQDFLRYRWSVDTKYKIVQAGVGSRPNRHTLRLHHLVMGHPPDGKETDHINHNCLDNRRANLRFVTSSQNSMNSRLRINNTTGFKGVSRKRNGWGAQIQFNYKKRYLGTFKIKIEAARAYNQAAQKLFGEYAHLNKGV